MTELEPGEVIDKLHALGLHDISGAITRERFSWMNTIGALERERAALHEALKEAYDNVSRASGTLKPDLVVWLEKARVALAVAKLGEG